MCSAEDDPNPKANSVVRRIERDSLGEMELLSDSLYGIHTRRALDNFPLSGRRVHPSLIHAFGQVKLAAFRANRELGLWDKDQAKADAIERACAEMVRGELDEFVPIDALQGGAGTSTNMSVNEVIANRAIQILGLQVGDYDRVSPLDDINRHQSTNDTYPTALKLTAIVLLRGLEEQLVALQEAFQEKEREFIHIVKIGRTQLQDAVLTTLGREMSAYAEPIGRDRWRVYKCEERLRVVNLGGTAIGTGLSAPRDYIFRVVEFLREQTGIGFARAENLVENTQNADVFVEVSGILKACAATLYKISSDLRLLSSGPEAGLGEISLPAVQAGSSIMPDKVNPVIPEAVTQAAILVMGNDMEIAMAAAAGSLELNPFLPLIADCLLSSIDLLTRACRILRQKCVLGLRANEERCRSNLEASTAVATALMPKIGYEKAGEIARLARQQKCTIREIVLDLKLMSSDEFDQMISPEAVMRLGTPPRKL
ncbi:MAG: aspartate ammonia-lyase [Candidatus Coatesbacteria bacterium]|nr:aspartate ammonia-lyase [Candidatus Coatesbacteria bacterium]